MLFQSSSGTAMLFTQVAVAEGAKRFIDAHAL